MREPFREDEDDDAPGACSFCGAAGDAELAEDGEFYCSRCWEEWAEGTAAEEPPPSASAPAPARRWGARREEHKAMPATPAEREPAAVPSGLGKAFFQSLDGAPQWADAPTRPEAGGKELVALRPKEERGTEEMASKKGPKAQLLTPGAATAPTAPSPTATSSSARSEPRFEELLRSLQPRLESEIVEYLSAMVTDADDFSEDLFETIQEILEGNGILPIDIERIMSSIKSIKLI
eukprot:g17301.t1